MKKYLFFCVVSLFTHYLLHMPPRSPQHRPHTVSREHMIAPYIIPLIMERTLLKLITQGRQQLQCVAQAVQQSPRLQQPAYPLQLPTIMVFIATTLIHLRTTGIISPMVVTWFSLNRKILIFTPHQLGRKRLSHRHPATSIGIPR